MKHSKWTLAYVATMLFALHATAVAEGPEIGSAKATKDKVEGVIDGQNQPLATGSVVFANETVRTGNTGIADLVFIDNTNLSVGPTSEVKLDKFVYDPGGSSGSVVIQATRGAFRFVTGSQDKHVYQVKTPFGTLGVRGTIVEMVLTPCAPGIPRTQCGVTLKLVEGGASFAIDGGQTVDLSQPNQVVNINGNGIVAQSNQANSILNFASLGSNGSLTTGSIGAGGGGGGGGTTGWQGPNGGKNTDPTNSFGGTTFGSKGSSGFSSLTSGGGISGTGVQFGASNSVSPH